MQTSKFKERKHPFEFVLWVWSKMNMIRGHILVAAYKTCKNRVHFFFFLSLLPSLSLCLVWTEHIFQQKNRKPWRAHSNEETGCFLRCSRATETCNYRPRILNYMLSMEGWSMEAGWRVGRLGAWREKTDRQSEAKKPRKSNRGGSGNDDEAAMQEVVASFKALTRLAHSLGSLW